MIGVFVNNNARRVKRDPRLVERLGRAGDGVEIIATRCPEELREKMRQLVPAGVELLASCGGDGTTQAVISTMIECFGHDRLPVLAILPAGTMNTVARNLGISGRPDAVLEQLIVARHSGEGGQVVRPRTLRVNDRHGFIFGAAMAARFLELYYEGRPGMRRALALAMKIPLGAIVGKPMTRRLFADVGAAVRVDGKDLPLSRWSLLVASTLPDIGLGIRVTYRAAHDPERFQLVASGLSGRRLALQFHRTFAGRPLRGDPHVDRLARAMRIVFDEVEAYMIDGELLHGRDVELGIGPRVRIWRP